MGVDRMRPAERGFALAELGATLAVAALVACLAGVGARQRRMAAGLAGSLANLKRMGEAGACYAADFDDRLWSLSWSVTDHDLGGSSSASIDWDETLEREKSSERGTLTLHHPRTRVTDTLHLTPHTAHSTSPHSPLPPPDSRSRTSPSSTLPISD